MSVSSGSDVTIPIQDSPPPPPSPYGNRNLLGGINPNVGTNKTPEPTGDVGVDNNAFQSTENQNNDPKSLNENDRSPSSTKKNHTEITINGHAPDTTSTLNEAVNPELINMNVLDTIPQKPQPEFGPYENFDEYFISVNQHKKFLRRGEKLYVTKDKRKTSKWKKYICWLIGAFILAAIVTVAVLAGVGLIPHKSPTTLSMVETTTTEIPDLINKPSSQPDFSTSTSERQQSSSTFVLDESTSISSSSITSTSLPPVFDNYVPSAAEIQLTLNNTEYDDELSDPTSIKYLELASDLERKIKRSLEEDGKLNTAFVKITGFSRGSIVAKIRLGWIDDTQGLTDVQRFVSTLRTIGEYEILPGTTSYPLYNLCKISNNDCTNYCTFDYESLNFLCTCPEHLLLAEDKKTCREIPSILPSPASTSDNITESETSSEPPQSPPNISSEIPAEIATDQPIHPETSVAPPVHNVDENQITSSTSSPVVVEQVNITSDVTNNTGEHTDSSDELPIILSSTSSSILEQTNVTDSATNETIDDPIPSTHDILVPLHPIVSNVSEVVNVSISGEEVDDKSSSTTKPDMDYDVEVIHELSPIHHSINTSETFAHIISSETSVIPESQDSEVVSGNSSSPELNVSFEGSLNPVVIELNNLSSTTTTNLPIIEEGLNPVVIPLDDSSSTTTNSPISEENPVVIPLNDLSSTSTVSSIIGEGSNPVVIPLDDSSSTTTTNPPISEEIVNPVVIPLNDLSSTTTVSPAIEEGNPIVIPLNESSSIISNPLIIEEGLDPSVLPLNDSSSTTTNQPIIEEDSSPVVIPINDLSLPSTSTTTIISVIEEDLHGAAVPLDDSTSTTTVPSIIKENLNSDLISLNDSSSPAIVLPVNEEVVLHPDIVTLNDSSSTTTIVPPIIEVVETNITALQNNNQPSLEEDSETIFESNVETNRTSRLISKAPRSENFELGNSESQETSVSGSEEHSNSSSSIQVSGEQAVESILPISEEHKIETVLTHPENNTEGAKPEQESSVSTQAEYHVEVPVQIDTDTVLEPVIQTPVENKTETNNSSSEGTQQETETVGLEEREREALAPASEEIVVIKDLKPTHLETVGIQTSGENNSDTSIPSSENIQSDDTIQTSEEGLKRTILPLATISNISSTENVQHDEAAIIQPSETNQTTLVEISTDKDAKVEETDLPVSDEGEILPTVFPRPQHISSDEFMAFSDANMSLVNRNLNTKKSNISINEPSSASVEGSSYESVSGDDSEISSGSVSAEAENLSGSQPKSTLQIEHREIEEVTTIVPISLINDTAVNDLTENVTEDLINTENIFQMSEESNVTSAHTENLGSRESEYGEGQVIHGVNLSQNTSSTVPTNISEVELLPESNPIEQSKPESTVNSTIAAGSLLENIPSSSHEIQETTAIPANDESSIIFSTIIPILSNLNVENENINSDISHISSPPTTTTTTTTTTINPLIITSSNLPIINSDENLSLISEQQNNNHDNNNGTSNFSLDNDNELQ